MPRGELVKRSGKSKRKTFTTPTPQEKRSATGSDMDRGKGGSLENRTNSSAASREEKIVQKAEGEKRAKKANAKSACARKWGDGISFLEKPHGGEASEKRTMTTTKKRTSQRKKRRYKNLRRGGK